MITITENIQKKLDALDNDVKEFVKILLKTNEKNEKRLNHIMSQSDNQQLQLMQLNENLKTISETDALTSLPNRLKCESTVNNLIEKRTPFSILAIDIDNFKTLNEKFNIAIANQVLVQISKQFKRLTKSGDFLGRWAGDTFIIIIEENTSLDEMIEKSEEICNKIEEFFFDDVGQVTVSIGVSSRSANSDLNTLINTLSKALNKAKDNGKNQVSH
ncbi:MAG: diguanylate cyclase (GGDEF)-like protein [Sulfurimonas sp.]|jgi:diguanylate cyclase (GGDEF)-like protein|uniref:GGDEF domain-containing protein n=1 Tax=Sulfurimonas sp. TaxID=2022749 RepID=UPI0039E49E80